LVEGRRFKSSVKRGFDVNHCFLDKICRSKSISQCVATLAVIVELSPTVKKIRLPILILSSVRPSRFCHRPLLNRNKATSLVDFRSEMILFFLFFLD